MHTLFASGTEPAVVRQKMGEGDLVVLALPEIFQNGHLAGGDHLALLDALAESGRPVVFDDFIHGIKGDAGILEILRQWGFGPFLVLAAVAALAAFWRRRTRLGPEEDDHRETRVEAVDLVDSLALLYNRSLLRRQALALYRQAFERALGVQTGLRGPALEARLREFLPGGLPVRPVRGRDLSDGEFQRGLQSVNDAFRRLSDAKRSRSQREAPPAPRPA
jgi:hypothetical protein